MTAKGMCPVTQKKEYIDFRAQSCGDNENPNLYIKLRLNSCSAKEIQNCPYGSKCPIYERIPENFNPNKV